MGNGCSKSILLSSPSLLPDTTAAANEEEESLGVAATAATAASVRGTNGSVSVSADSKDNADVPISGDGHNDGNKYILREAPVGIVSDGCIDLIIGSLSQEVLFQLLLVFRQQCAAERRRMLSPPLDPTTAAAASHNVMPAAVAVVVSVDSTSRNGYTKKGGGLLSLLDRSFKRLSLNKDSLYSLFPSIHSRHHRQLVCDLLLLYEPLDPSSQSLINDRAPEDIDRFMRSCSLVTPSQLLKAFQVVSHLPACAVLRDFESTSPSEGKGLLDRLTDQQCNTVMMMRPAVQCSDDDVMSPQVTSPWD